MSVPATIVDKLRNYEYEKRGCGGAVGDIYALIHHIAALEEERDELRGRVKELEVYEEIEMIGPHPGLPTVGGTLRERNAAQAEAEDIRYQLAWANERIRDLENNIRSHKRVCPMF